MRLNSCSFVALMRGSIGGGLCWGATLVAAPIGIWTFDETSGPTASDSSGNSLNAILSGSPSWTSGHQQGALQLDGTGTYGTIPDSPLLDGTDQLTISFWVKPTGLDENPRFILSKRTSQKQNQSYALFFGTGNKLNVDINLNEGIGDRFESSTVFENDQWYQITLVFDGRAHPSQRARLYVNGSLDRDAALSTTFIPDRASSLFIGTGQGNHPYKFEGLLDELSISRDIPAEESLASAHQGLWTIENWQQMAYKEIGDLVKDPKFYRTPSSKKVLSEVCWISGPTPSRIHVHESEAPQTLHRRVQGPGRRAA